MVTGTLTRFTREEITELIQQNGGKAAGSVSKKTDFWSPAKKPAASSTKAQKLNVPVITEVEFLRLIGQ